MSNFHKNLFNLIKYEKALALPCNQATATADLWAQPFCATNHAWMASRRTYRFNSFLLILNHLNHALNGMEKCRNAARINFQNLHRTLFLQDFLWKDAFLAFQVFLKWQNGNKFLCRYISLIFYGNLIRI